MDTTSSIEKVQYSTIHSEITELRSRDRARSNALVRCGLMLVEMKWAVSEQNKH